MHIISNSDFEGFIKGDHQSFENIFRQYHKTLLSFAFRYHIHEMEAEDIVLEVFYNVWQIHKDMKSPGALRVYLYTSVHNRAVNLLRDNQNRNRILEERVPKEDDDKLFDELLVEEETALLLEAAIRRLSPMNRRVILASLEGKTLKQIAGEMGISINSVKTYKLRSITALRKILKETPCALILLSELSRL